MAFAIRGKIPITIYPTFWVFAAIIGFLNSMTLLGTVVWVGIIFVSVLIHELGHALTAKLFGRAPRIELVALGGLTYHDGEKLPFWKQFFIVLDGPLFGFLLFLLATFLLQVPRLAQGLIGETLVTFQKVNLFWTFLNLLPIMPLDGGQLLRVILEAIFGVRGLKFALVVSMIFATLMSLFFFLYRFFLIGAIFFLLAYQSYETWKRSRLLDEGDRSDDIKRLFETAEGHLQSGRKELAEELFEKIRRDAKHGMLYLIATQHLAYLKYEQGKAHEAFALLLPIRSELSGDTLCLLHRLAFEEKNYPLTVELGGTCYQNWPSAELALRNAFASAYLSQVEPAIGWLQTALQEGLPNPSEAIANPAFDTIRTSPAFQHLLLETEKKN